MSAIISSSELGLLVNAQSHALVNRWLARGDGVAVYRSQAMDSAWLGHRVFMSYGSPEAQISTTMTNLPPDACPTQSRGMGMAWAYRLESHCPPGRYGARHGSEHGYELIPAEVTAERELIDEREAAEDAAAAKKAKRAKKVRS